MAEGLTGAVMPTFRYPRFVWNGTTVDFPDPIASVDAQDTPAVGTNITSDGHREVLFERFDQLCSLQFTFLTALKAHATRRMITEWAGRGKQVEVFVDRFLRGQWLFEGSPLDQNGGNQFRSSDPAATLAYATLTDNKQALTLPSSGVLSAPLVNDLPGGSGNKYVGTDEGTLVLYFKAGFAGNDGAEHVLLDCYAESDLGKNRLQIKKRVDNKLHVVLYGANGAGTARSVAVSWLANTEHYLFVEWTTAIASFKASLDGVEMTTKEYFYVADAAVISGTGRVSGEVKGTTAAGNEQSFGASPTRATLGIDAHGLMGRASGSIGLLSIYNKVYSPSFPQALKTFYVFYPTYYPRGELGAPVYGFARSLSGRELFAVTLPVRAGK